MGLPGNGAAAPAGLDVKQACTVLYNRLPPLQAAQTQALLSPVVGSDCRVEWAASSQSDVQMVAGLTQWDDHRVVMIALRAPVREEVLARTVAVSPMPEDLRAYLLNHKAAIRLLYVGDSEDRLEQLTALYRVAGALLAQGGLGLLNERAALALPAALAFTYLAQLGSPSPPIPLWTGAVTFNMEDDAAAQPYFLRTYGMEQLALPELGIFMPDRLLADEAYHTLINIALYVVESSPTLEIEAGHRTEFKGRTYLLTDPDMTGPEFTSPSGLLMLVDV